MTVEEATPASVRYVAERMRDSDYREFVAVSHATSRRQLVDTMTDLYGRHPGSMCARYQGRPVAIGAMVEGRPNVVTLMFFATKDLPKIAIPLTRFIRNILFPRYREEGVHRIECISIDGYVEAHRWIGLLGLKHEAVFPGYGKGGETYHQFSWTKP